MGMETQLFFDLTTPASACAIHFCEHDEVAVVLPGLVERGVAVMEIDGASISKQEELFRAFAVALRMPKGWYGDEEYATNENAFLEYLDDVHEWVPAKGHVVILRGAEKFWKINARLAGSLVECWQFATGPRKSDIHLVFVW
jgi:hypothetical protein